MHASYEGTGGFFCWTRFHRELWFVSVESPAEAFPYLAPLLRNGYSLPPCEEQARESYDRVLCTALGFRKFADKQTTKQRKGEVHLVHFS